MHSDFQHHSREPAIVKSSKTKEVDVPDTKLQSVQLSTRCESSSVSLGVDNAIIRELSVVNSWLGGFHVLFEWIMIFATILICHQFWNPLFYLLVVAFIGARQHALLILMHEGTHYRLLRNKQLNDWVSELFLAWPNLTTMKSYRHNHLAHHRHLNAAGDPDWTRKKDDSDWQFPMRPWEIVILFAKDLVGVGAVALIRVSRSLAANDPGKSSSLAWLRLAFYGIASFTIIAFGLSKVVLLYWIVPFSTWLILIMHIRSIAEHFAIDNGNAASKTRTTTIGSLERIFIAPKNVNYHSEHHLFPSVPFYRLPELHKILVSMKNYPAFSHLTRGYAGVLRECGYRPAQSAESNFVAGGRLATNRTWHWPKPFALTWVPTHSKRGDEAQPA